MSCVGDCVLGVVKFVVGRFRRGGDWPGNVWIDQYHEEAIDPEEEIIDPHHHLWDVQTQPKGYPIPQILIKLLFAVQTPEGINKGVIKSTRDTAPAALPTFCGRSERQIPFIMPYMGAEMELDIRNRDCGKRGHKVVQTVYIQCGWHEKGVPEALKAVGEAHMAAAVHKEFPKLCNGVVAWANLHLDDVESTLQALKAIPEVRGVRHSLAWTADKLIFSEDEAMTLGGKAAFAPTFFRGFSLLEKYGFSYDTWCYHEQLEGLADLAAAFPKTTIVVDHVALPLGIGSYTKEGTFPVWEKGIRALAQASKNVHVKLSGLCMCVVGFHWDDRPVPPSSQELAEGFRPYIKVALEAFGVERCMFASNFPVDRVSCDYTVLWNAFKLIAKDFTREERRALVYGNAKRIYRL